MKKTKEPPVDALGLQVGSLFDRLVGAGEFSSWHRMWLVEKDVYGLEVKIEAYEIALPGRGAPFTAKAEHFIALLMMDRQELPRFITTQRNGSESFRSKFPDMLTVPFAEALLSSDEPFFQTYRKLCTSLSLQVGSEFLLQ